MAMFVTSQLIGMMSAPYNVEAKAFARITIPQNITTITTFDEALHKTINPDRKSYMPVGNRAKLLAGPSDGSGNLENFHLLKQIIDDVNKIFMPPANLPQSTSATNDPSAPQSQTPNLTEMFNGINPFNPPRTPPAYNELYNAGRSKRQVSPSLPRQVRSLNLNWGPHSINIDPLNNPLQPIKFHTHSFQQRSQPIYPSFYTPDYIGTPQYPNAYPPVQTFFDLTNVRGEHVGTDKERDSSPQMSATTSTQFSSQSPLTSNPLTATQSSPTPPGTESLNSPNNSSNSSLPFQTLNTKSLERINELTRHYIADTNPRKSVDEEPINNQHFDHDDMIFDAFTLNDIIKSYEAANTHDEILPTRLATIEVINSPYNEMKADDEIILTAISRSVEPPLNSSVTTNSSQADSSSGSWELIEGQYTDDAALTMTA